jgi:RNA polymerase sigma factor (sigma-70 family)
MGTDVVHAALTTPYVTTLIRSKAVRLSRSPGFRRSDQPDLEQELAAHVLRQASRYDAARGSVNTFIDRVVTSAAAMIVRDRRRLKRGSGQRAISLDQTHIQKDQRQMTLAQVVCEDDLCRRCGGRVHDGQQAAELSADLARAMAALTPEQREIAVRLTLAPEAVVARELGISRRQVRSVVAAIRERFQEAGLSEI